MYWFSWLAIATRINLISVDSIVTSAEKNNEDGRICAVDCSIGDKKVRLASAYGPVDPSKRKEFIEKASKILNKDTICGGDWNWVPDETWDQEGPDTNHQNAHATAGEAMIQKAGLVDVFRLLHGPKKREYTRISGTVSRRLDRIYAPKYNSLWRWTVVKANHEIFRNMEEGKSDHLSVTAEVECATDRPASKAERKINPKILQVTEVRKVVKHLLLTLYGKREDGMTRQEAWVRTKAAIAEYLLDKSYEKCENPEESTLKATLHILYHAAKTKPPNIHVQSKIRQCEDELAALKKKRKTSRYWAWVSALKEECSSKSFYKMFKRKWASSEISSLHMTPDWDDPEKKGEELAESVEDILAELGKYYGHLFQHKPSRNPDRMLKLLRKKKLSPASAKHLDRPLELAEVTKAVRTVACGKSPGPDALPGEFYREFETEVAHILYEVFREIDEIGEMCEDLRSGDIIILYKKGDPREIRNYRPITLLQVDYKIRSKILVARLKPAVDDIVNRAQLGFVPGRNITEATHLLKLVQAYVDEMDEEAIIVAADWEKAFDRVSWDYMFQALDALEFGPYITGWIGTMYNTSAPPTRNVKSNGQRSPAFYIKSGVPQGCPASPLIFLIVAEALTRAVEHETRIKGIDVHGTEVKITQFADDTQFLLRGFKHLKWVWPILKEYEGATAMRANMKKFEGLRCGRLKKKPVPLVQELCTDMIQWVKPGSYMRILGIPYWEEYEERKFFDKLYGDAKARMAAWTDHAYLTLVGRNMVANAMYFSRFRYVCQTMAMPIDIIEAIESDAQALIWGGETEFDADETGTLLSKRRWIKKEAQYATRKIDAGAGVLSWSSHLKGLQAKKMLEYLDESRGVWKEILDHWWGGRFEEGRGVVLCTTPEKLLNMSETGFEAKIPKFWKQALHNIRCLKLVELRPGMMSKNAARAIPLWCNSLFSLPNLQTMRMWRDVMQLRTVKDTVKEDGQPYTEPEIEQYIRARLQVEGDHAKVGRGRWLTIRTLLNQWNTVVERVPDSLKRRATVEEPMEGVYSEVALKLMKNMGWTRGEGLGHIGKQGVSEPALITTNAKSRNTQANKEGLGLKPRRGKHGGHKEAITAVVGERLIEYGKLSGHAFHVHELSTKGIPKPTGRTRMVHPGETREILRWGKGIVGVAESHFPHPNEWTLGGINKPLDKITTRDLTREFTDKITKAPSCVKKWLEVIESVGEGVNAINFRTLMERYKVGLITPKDFGSHFKLILHRAMLTNPHNPEAETSSCRLCGLTRESIWHWGECEGLKPIFETLRVFDGGQRWDDLKLNLFGINEMKGRVPDGTSALHFMAWKFILIQMTQMSLKKQAFDSEEIIKYAVRRLHSRVKTAEYRITMIRNKAFAQNSTPNYGTIARWTEGIAEVHKDSGVLTPHEALVDLWKKYEIT